MNLLQVELDLGELENKIKGYLHIIIQPLTLTTGKCSQCLPLEQEISRLHNKKVVYRDIRWDNVVKLTDGKWLLIDFEKAARIGDERYSSNGIA
ncbi:hypothetical protein RhiirC2_789968 [Rhizophagus irregularis]|uniref:Protein kinase domain-containing protein n=1 Tax=Rhizophagus irregularis TaxID=588596 RepID=A0A2N1MM47_9GLOM|nr:hypothetical protein RhiirC2_789968 [Rhizophagus irregularis]